MEGTLHSDPRAVIRARGRSVGSRAIAMGRATMRGGGGPTAATTGVAGKAAELFHPRNAMKPDSPPTPIASRAIGISPPTWAKGSKKRASPRDKDVSATAGRRNR